MKNLVSSLSCVTSVEKRLWLKKTRHQVMITRKEGHASRYHPLQELAKDSIQTLILEDVFKLLDELPKPGEEEGIECGIHRFKLDRS
jgi:hypothetical protein